MKISIGSLIILLLLSFSGCAGTDPSRWDGFRGLKWATNIKDIKDHEAFFINDSNGFEFYGRSNDKLSFGNAKLKAIVYGYYKDRFCGVVITAKGYKNFTALKDAVFAYYGEGKQENKNIKKWLWVSVLGNSNKDIEMSLEYSESSEETRLTIAYNPIVEEQRKEQEENKRVQELDKERVARERGKVIREANKNLVKTRDEMEEVDFYHAQSLDDIRHGRDYIEAYIAKKDYSVWLCFKMYHAGDLLLIKSVLFKVDGEDFKLTYGFFDDWKRDTNGHIYWEWKDVLVDKYIWNLINKIAKSEKTMMRYEGQQYHFDRDVSPIEKEALKNILLAYRAKGGEPPTE
ncbi:MAG: hypothetical protein ABSB91_00185 [Sedimentisphaerales bacterium]